MLNYTKSGSLMLFLYRLLLNIKGTEVIFQLQIFSY